MILPSPVTAMGVGSGLDLKYGEVQELSLRIWLTGSRKRIYMKTDRV